jgi:hypothetical protein
MDIAMRMPWTVLSELISRKSSQDDEAGEPVHKLVSLKIRVAESEVVTRSAEPISQTSTEAETISSIALPLAEVEEPTEDDQTRAADDVVPHTLDVEEHEGAEVEAEVRVEVLERASFFQSVDDNQDVQAEASDRGVEAKPVDTLSKEVVQTVILEKVPAARPAKPPILDLPNTRARAASAGMEELDDEIAELRRVLSAKLSVQNEQLRQMLRRFPT